MWLTSRLRISASRPTPRSRPERRIAMRSHSVSASERMWVENRMVFPRFLRSEDDVAHQTTAQGIEARHGLVQDHQLGVVHQGLGQAGPLHHSLRKAPQGEVRRALEPHQTEEAGRPVLAHGRAQAEEPPHVVQVLAGGQIVVEVGVLRQVAGLRPPRAVGERPPQDRYLSGVGEEEAGEDLEGGGLAGAVRSQVAEDLAPVHLEGEAVKHALPLLENVPDAVGLRQASEGNGAGGEGLRHPAEQITSSLNRDATGA